MLFGIYLNPSMHDISNFVVYILQNNPRLGNYFLWKIYFRKIHNSIFFTEKFQIFTKNQYKNYQNLNRFRKKLSIIIPSSE
jgi:hypothetical protein